jgi:hypothetical protein
VANTKSLKPITSAEVPRIFDEACIDRLAARLPESANRKRFGQGVRWAADNYTKEVRVPAHNKLTDEIAALYRAANGTRCGHVADLLEALSSQTREFLSKRATHLNIELPAPEELRKSKRQKACNIVLMLCQHGGYYVEGRQRPSGRRSRTWCPILHAREPIPKPAKRDAERNFIMFLQLTWLEATGVKPALSANAASLTATAERAGPFIKMAKECLELIGATHADVVGLINELNRRRKIMTGPVRPQN